VIGQPYNTVSAADRHNFTLLMKEFRTQLDAINGKHYLLTAALGSGKDKIDATEPGQYGQYMDWVNLMSYDFHGGFEPQGPTDFQSNLYPDQSSPNYFDPLKPGVRSVASYYNIDEAVGILVQSGMPPGKINLGVPFYGRGWTGVPNVNNGLYQKASAPARGTYEAGIEDYKVLKNAPGTVFVHPVTKQSYKFDGTNFWSYDTPDVIQTKINYLKSKGLGGIFSWSLDGDLSGELMKATAGAK
jgi:chitinase